VGDEEREMAARRLATDIFRCEVLATTLRGESTCSTSN
jgi:hypothetical protein